MFDGTHAVHEGLYESGASMFWLLSGSTNADASDDTSLAFAEIDAWANLWFATKGGHRSIASTSCFSGSGGFRSKGVKTSGQTAAVWPRGHAGLILSHGPGTGGGEGRCSGAVG